MPIPSTNDQMKRQSTKDLIYQAVCNWIISGELLPGEKINDMELAKHFNVSRTPVREAIQMLEIQKLVRVIPGKTTIVTEVDKKDICDCYRPLACIQALAAELACTAITEEQLSRLEAVHHQFSDACKNNDPENAILCDSEFHAIIMDCADNQYMEEFSQTMILHIQRIKYHYFHSDRLRKTSVGHHEGILEAIKAKDADLAGSRMKNHWLYVMQRCLNDVLDENDEANPSENLNRP
ncbi:GntR family transcriptional regulator [uncultured Sphaerochaeta sp.]|uniref:GntR family transcriptional regulator n=1 Tax=uncultured Sphaerochaeta sp. TaxID=886478 RepID=UPI002A0A269E|nr:GntR family transcriptional regulator [uncultured Sphaerochaeta sp.]